MLLLGLMAMSMLCAQEFTRGLGVYPGDPKEDFAPALVADATTYRNLALRRPAYHSSRSDYNQTAQLVTDGIKETTLPRAVVVTTSSPPAPPASGGRGGRGGMSVGGDHPWIQYQFTGGAGPLAIDRVEIAVGGGFGGRG